MNRRSFLKGLVAAAVATQCPWQSLPQLPKASEIVMFVEKFDFGMAVGVGAKVGKYRHAVWMPSSKNDEADIAFLKRELIKAMRLKGWIA